MKRFLTSDVPPLILDFAGKNTDEVIALAKQGILDGAEGFCFQTCYMDAEYRTPSEFRKIFEAMQGLPIYVTNYRHHTNEGASDEALAEGLIMLADCGATLCDVMGDLYDPQAEEMTYNPFAVERQKTLISQLHEKDAQVLMSAHIYRFLTQDEVLKIALSQQERGADIAKIVTFAYNAEQERENIKIISSLKNELGIPFLFLSNGVCSEHRRSGPSLGCCLYLCSPNDAPDPKAPQPSLKEMKAIRRACCAR